jgi:uncharacterized protein YfbU (UPF0304 family)
MNKEQRTILTNQFELLSKLDPSHADEHLYKAEILRRGFEGLYGEVLVGDSTVSQEVCDEVYEILGMCHNIEQMIGHVKSEYWDGVDVECLRFEGFDLNEEPHYGVADLIINKPRQFEMYKERYLNTHGPGALWKYRRMLPVYRQLLEERNTPWTKEHLQRLERAVKGQSEAA